MSNIVFFVLIAIAVVLIVMLLEKQQNKRKKKPGQHLVFQAPGKSVAQCRALLGKKGGSIFDYKLEMAKNGTQYITFTKHLPTGQLLETVYLLVYEDDTPARISLTFVNEVFGYKEPVFEQSLLEDFFYEILGAVKIDENSEEEL